jgi:hypothetical protein
LEAAVQIKNVNPLGAVDLPLIGRSLEAGEVFEVPDKVGKELLKQVGNYEEPTKTEAKAADKAAVQAEKEATT